MAASKRANDTSLDGRRTKKLKTEKHEKPQATAKSTDEVDFPRGGGTTLTPLEVKALRAEAVKEANEELFEEKSATKKPKRRKSLGTDASKTVRKDKSDSIRIEHLNYKRMNIGMKILGQIVSIQPLALIVSLPNQLFAHVPITHISSQLTSLLEDVGHSDEGSGMDEDEDELAQSRVPELSEIFAVGEYVRGIVTAVHPPGVGDVAAIGRSRDEMVRTSRRVELSLVPERVNQGVVKDDLKQGFTLSASVRSKEDHGYVLDLGVPDVPAFLPFKDIKKHLPEGSSKFHIGRLVNVVVVKAAASGRTCNVTLDAHAFSSSLLTEVTNVTSVLPGTLVQCLVTAVHPTGLNLQVLGFFDGTIEQLHLEHDHSYKVGKKVRARVLYDYSLSPPRFALSLCRHVINLKPRLTANDGQDQASPLQVAYPQGTILESAKVTQVENDRGLLLEVHPGLEGFVHISHVADDHVASLSASSGPYKVGSIHRARVTGYFAFDGILQLSLKPSVLAQKFFHVDELEIGEVVKGTIKKLTDSGLFVSLSGKFDGVVWPNHYADIFLKHPAKRFKLGASIKCRILAIDSERNRISLTAKKTLIESTLPILTKFDDAKVGLLTHAVVFKVTEKQLMIEFFNNLKAVVLAKEVSESKLPSLAEAFPVGKVIKVRVIAIDPDSSRIFASIRQATSAFEPPSTNLDVVEIGDTVEGSVLEIHKENVVLSLQTTNIKALLSLKNLANHQGGSASELQQTLRPGTKLAELVVVTKNPDKGFVLVANKPKSTGHSLGKSQISLETVQIGQIVSGRVTRHTRNGALFKFGPHTGGILHPTDLSDDYDTAVGLPNVNAIVQAAVIGIDSDRKQLILSTRRSKMAPSEVAHVKDPEIVNVADLIQGMPVRGFIKSITQHGLFVAIGKNIDARVQIKELFDEYVKDWQSRFKLNHLVSGRILAANTDDGHVEITFRSGDLSKPRISLAMADLQEGQKVEGTVKKIEDYGLFIQIADSKLTGLCHKSQLSDNKDADITVALRGFRVGDRVKAIVLEISKGRLSLGLKPSYFDDDDDDDDDDDGDDDDAGSGKEEAESIAGEHHSVIGAEGEDTHMMDKDPSCGNPSDEDEASDVDDSEDVMQIDAQAIIRTIEEPLVPQPSSSKSLAPSLHMEGGFQWSSGQLHAEDDSNADSSSDEGNADEPGKRKKRRKRQIEQDLTADMHTKTPESNTDFERVLLGSPNSSYLWIQYMSFQLQLSEVDKAREIAKRSIRTINFREEQEKLNVWIALLNLENVYGTDETLETTFKDAARHNDSKTVHLRLAAILDQSDKTKKAEEQYQRTCKKFGQSSKVWTSFGEFLLRRGELQSARNLLSRSLQSLHKRKHIKTISRFAQLEYRLGDPERGKTIFEGIVDSHPKRWDMWSIYIDMEVAQRDIQSVRNLFNRVLVNKMTSHKAKAFFKKWLELERRIGDEEGADVVKQKAVEWTQRANA